MTTLKPEVEYYMNLHLYEEGCFLCNRGTDKLLTVEEMAWTAVAQKSDIRKNVEIVRLVTQ